MRKSHARRLENDMGNEDDSMKSDVKDVDERESYKFEPHPLYPYENKNIKNHPYYKEHKEEMDAILHWIRRAHGDE